MSFFKKLFGGSREKKAAANGPSASVEQMRQDPNLIGVHDEYGRELFITKDEWRKNILPGALQQHWDDAEALYRTVVGAVEDGFAEDVVDAAERVKAIHPDHRVGVAIHAIALMKSGRLDQAEAELTAAIQNHGREGVFLTNLAKVAGEKGDKREERKLLWDALEADPNQDNAVMWWAAIHREEEGEVGYRKALLKAAEIEGSWYPQVWLARLALDGGHKDEAMGRYGEIAAKNSELPANVLMQISGDLGNAGMLNELVDITEKLYDAEVHGLTVGNNLIKAHLELGNPKRAQEHVVALRKFDRADWAETLAFWENELDKASGKYGPVENAEPPQITVMVLDRPVWSLKLKEPDELLAAVNKGLKRVAVVMASCGRPGAVQGTERPELDGILSRGLPLLLTESAAEHPELKATAIVPVHAATGAFVLMGQPWSPEAIRSVVGKGDYDFAVSAHLDPSTDPWDVTFELHDLSVADAAPISSQFPFNPQQPDSSLATAFGACTAWLADALQLAKPMRTPSGRSHLGRYMSAIGQSLALSIATSGEAAGENLFGERNILDALLALALEEPLEPKAVLLFIGALAKNKGYGSEIYSDYRRKAEKLLEERLPEGEAGRVAKATFEATYLNSES